MRNFIFTLVVGVSTAGAYIFQGNKRMLQDTFPICEAEETACMLEEICKTCMMTGYIPERPTDTAECEDLRMWFYQIYFPYQDVCDHRNGGNLLSDVIFCRYDTYVYEAGLAYNCDINSTSDSSTPSYSLTAYIPTVAPTAALTASPTYRTTLIPIALAI